MARKKSRKVKSNKAKSPSLQYSKDLEALKGFLNIDTSQGKGECQCSGADYCAKFPTIKGHADYFWVPSTADVKPKMPFLDTFYDLRNWLMVAALLILAVGVIFNDGLMIILSLVTFFGWAMIVSDFLHYNKRDK